MPAVWRPLVAKLTKLSKRITALCGCGSRTELGNIKRQGAILRCVTPYPPAPHQPGACPCQQFLTRDSIQDIYFHSFYQYPCKG